MSNTKLWPYALVAVAGVAVLGFAGCAVHDATTERTPVSDAPWDPFDPSSQPQHTPDAGTPPGMFDGDTGVLRVGIDIYPGTYSATPVGEEGFYSIITCWDEGNPACDGTAVFVTEPTMITVPSDAVGLTVAYLKLEG